ncbi:hypothetical protein XENOCAPTIV_029355, partial [Xenoophorus captivus]
CQFSTFEQCQEWLKRLNAVVRPPSRLEDLFSFAFHAWCMEVYAGLHPPCLTLFSLALRPARLCPSYPQQLLVPAWITDKELENVAAFRSWKRFPAVVYSWLSALESTKWLQHLSLLLKAALLVVNAVDRDHRPVLVHCSDGWDRTPQIVALSKLLLDPYYRTIEGFQVLVETEWLDFGHKFADRCGHGENSEDLNERCPVFLQWLDCVHQLQRQFPCSFEFNEAFLVRVHLLVVVQFTQLYFPTLNVFMSKSEDGIYLIIAYLHISQFPSGVKLVQHTYSCLFGTFLCNSGKEREDRHVQERTCSVWSLLRPANRMLRNMLYSSHSETVLHPVCHVRNLMLWTAVYLPSSSPTTPSDDSCAPYPEPGANPEDAPLGRRTKTRSFDNLPSACELGSALAPNRRSSDPSLNEKWQDHRRSLELNMAVGSEGGGNQELQPNGEGPCTDGQHSELGESQQSQESRTVLRQDIPVSPAGEEVEKAELSVVVGVAEGQMENILQEAREEAGADIHGQRPAAVTKGITAADTEVKCEGENLMTVVNGTEMHRDMFANGHHPKNIVAEAEEDGDSAPHPLQKEERLDQHPADKTQTPEGDVEQGVKYSSVKEEPRSGEQQPSAAHRTVTNGFVDRSPEEQDVDETCPVSEPEHCVSELGEQVDKRVSLMESSTETLTEEACSKLEPPGQQSVLLNRQLQCDGRSQHPCFRKDKETAEHGFSRTLNGSIKHASVSAFQSASAELSREGLCNGDCTDGDPYIGPHWSKGNGERAPLSRQVSIASCNSLILYPRGSCSQHRWCHAVLTRATISPEQPSRSHLDDDGLTLHTDAIQQRLRQIEAGHQMEVETLKKQVQELWSRLENQQHAGYHRINGDMGDEVTSVTDSEYNLDPNCLSRCSTELFSEASWEQVDKQDTEVTRWYPDHLAAQCYGCESRFWLAARKHHCRNCGNVFCASCCDQKIPVPSQQLFEPCRVCKNCYSSLQLSSAPLDHELEKPITASSN